MAVEYKELQVKVILCDIFLLSRRNHSLAKRHDDLKKMSERIFSKDKSVSWKQTVSPFSRVLS